LTAFPNKISEYYDNFLAKTKLVPYNLLDKTQKKDKFYVS